ncbi:MAG: efflux RND transporter periplasmic adaptor subunit [Planctomycetes bacterium]|nr:efflux RND transporter periplasmic adaptor subunit [Planctomycetota bacterium]MCB9917349.1 efflux RND transporter periplasmic adaptor subunit [Planctomycetota bacterium]
MIDVASADLMSVSALQCELRMCFLASTRQQGIQDCLELLAGAFGSQYAVAHARIGAQILSEEWSLPELPLDDRLREMVTNVMLDAMATGNAKCKRLLIDGEESAIVAALLFDEDGEQAGALAILARGCDRDRARAFLARFEGLVGFLALLLTIDPRSQDAKNDAASRIAQACDISSHPLRLAFGMVAELKNRHGFALASIGFVKRRKVRVVAVSGLEEIRAANPGIRQIRGAMEECLDRSDIVLHQSRVSAFDERIEDDCHLHRQWSTSLGGDSVASFPLMAGDEVVAVISVTKSPEEPLTHAMLDDVRAEMADFGRIVPLSQAASRSVLQHAGDAIAATGRAWVGKGRRKFAVLACTSTLAVAWLVFGTLPFRFTVPSVVAPASQRVVAAPRDGLLAEVFVRPGDVVTEDQLLAVLDDHEDVLRLAELRASLSAVSAKSDRALAERESGLVRVYEAEEASLLAQVAMVQANIERARVRAPHAGVVLEGDLEEQLGGRVSLGQELFRVAQLDRMRILMRVPEDLVRDAREAGTATFSSTARPDEDYELKDLRVAPASTVLDGKNVFQTEGMTKQAMSGLSPGMEGVAYVDAGSRPAWFVLTRRITNWLRLNFWI